MAYDYVIETGVIVPDTADLEAEVVAEFKAALGQDLITTANTPQGVLIAGEVSSRAAAAANNAALANQINPNLAGGVFLDAIWALTGGQRFAARPSICRDVALTGLAGTFIPEGSRAALADGTLFASVADVTLDGGGSATVDFQAVESGPVEVAIGALNVPVTAVLGWDSLSNPTVAEIGQSTETDAASRLRRRNTLSLQNVALPESAVSALYALAGVRSLQYRENYTKSDATIDGIFLLANSVWACVDGGTNSEIALALLENKSIGPGWNGSVVVNLPHPATGQTYLVKFDRPDAVPVAARVTVKRTDPLVDASAVVKKAILDYAGGAISGEPGFTVGASVSPFELAAAVNQASPGLYVKKVELSLASPISWSTSEIAIALDEKATITGGNISVIVE